MSVSHAFDTHDIKWIRCSIGHFVVFIYLLQRLQFVITLSSVAFYWNGEYHINSR